MINIAIDGPSGGGKSTLAKMLAKELGYLYVDTGALYRAIGLYIREQSIDIENQAAVISALDNINLTLKHENGKQQVFLNGRNVDACIRTPEIAKYAAAVAAIPEVRTFLLSIQKDIAQTENVIMDGRDIGTVILPDAQVKIYLFASCETRARRRYAELTAKGEQTTYEEILAAIKERDYKDSNREASPAAAASDAIQLDNSDLSLEDTFKAALAIIKDKIG